MSRIAQIVWLALTLFSSPVFSQNDVRWAPDLPTAQRAAAQFQVPLLIHFYGDNCLPCKTLEQRVLNQDSVIKTLNKYFICVRINASQERTIASDYQVHSWPTDVFVSPDGQLLFQGVCKQDVSGYMEVLQSVAVSNRDRNSMIAADRAKQTSTANQLLSSAPSQPQTQSLLPAIAPQASSSQFAAPPSIASSTPSSQFQVPAAQNAGISENTGQLPPRAAHLVSTPLGSDGLGTRKNISGQMNAQVGLPQVANISSGNQNSISNQKPLEAKPASSLVSNPYYPETEEPMVCTPDGKCGPASTMLRENAIAGKTTQPNSSPNKTVHLVSDSQPVMSTPQFPPLPSGTDSIDSGSPTFQPKSASTTTPSASGTTNEAALGLIGTSTPTAAEKAAYNGFCPVSLVKSGTKVQGTIENAVRHRGRTYLMESSEAVKQFLESPDRYSPVLSGYDPMIFLESGTLVDGVLEHALHDPTSGTIVLFANAESQAKFKADPARNVKALGYILNAMNKK